MENGKHKIKLDDPVKFGSELVDTLEMSVPKAKHIRKLPVQPTLDDILKICADLAGRPDSFIDELSFRDVNKLAEFFNSFS